MRLRAPRSVRLGALSSVLAAALLLAVAPAANAAGDTIAIGDSVMLGAESALLKRGIEVVDAMKNRQAPTGISIIKEFGRKLPESVVFHLGTNGAFPLTMCRDILEAVGRKRHVFILTLAVPRTWEAQNNRRIRRCAASHVDRVTLIDWHRATRVRPEWLAGDGVHLQPLGANGYARLIAKAVRPGE